MKRWWMRWWHHKGQCPVCKQWVLLEIPHGRPVPSRPHLIMMCEGIAL